ncbi:MAG TPA: metal-dependent transcriptional regulator [Lacibacter sp.]|nr:metal-dependent transcriptional regulator [Lacibacter sp.]HMO89422.1 metal-dependent transcriptional regulator [Lacibacter sp.]HMP88367.1 metal-dependent transcriptional regulator [Lacibacter sp.]
MNFSEAEENYIKAIWRLQQQDKKVSTNALATALQTKPASVTDMLKRLAEKKLIDYLPYYGVTLNAEGRRLALRIVRRHRLWEYFLAEKLGFSWEAVHAIAEELEHVSSPELIDRLDAYLGHPQTDPHGDPIPDAAGNMKPATHIRLSQLDLRTPAVVSGVGDQRSSLLELLQQKQISIGTTLEITRRFEWDGSAELLLNRKQRVEVTEQLLHMIHVTPLTDAAT